MPASNESHSRQPAVFLDRDGTIMKDVNYCGDPQQVDLFPGVGRSLERLKKAGFKIIVITNQSGIGRGYFSEQDYRDVELEVGRQVGAGLIDATYYCPDLPGNGSNRRKPEAGMIFEAERDHGIDLRRSFMVGDKPIDIECGQKAGVRTLLVRTGTEQQSVSVRADWEAGDLVEAAEIILRHAI